MVESHLVPGHIDGTREDHAVLPILDLEISDRERLGFIGEGLQVGTHFNPAVLAMTRE